MAVELRVLQPEEFYRQHMAEGRRPDHRGLLERRSQAISAGNIATVGGGLVMGWGAGC